MSNLWNYNLWIIELSSPGSETGDEHSLIYTTDAEMRATTGASNQPINYS